MSRFDWYACVACGRSARSIQGHDPLRYCYGCGARAMEQHVGPDDFSALFGEPKRVPEFECIAVEFPGDVRYDPWTAVRLPGSPMMIDGLRFEAVQLEAMRPLLGSRECASQ